MGYLDVYNNQSFLNFATVYVFVRIYEELLIFLNFLVFSNLLYAVHFYCNHENL